MILSLKLAIRNIFRHKIRSCVTLSAIACGCVSIIFVGGYFDDTFSKMRESYIHAHSGHLRIAKRGFARHGRVDPYKYLIENPAEIIPAIKQVPGVSLVTPRLRFSGMLSDRDRNYPCIAEGIIPEDKVMKKNTENRKDSSLMLGGIILSGEKMTSQEPFDVMLGEGLAKRLHAKVGQGLVHMASTIGGSFNALDVNVRGIFFTSKIEYDDYVVLLPLESSQELLRSDRIQSLFVLLDETEQTDEIKGTLEQLIRNKGWNLEVTGWREMNEFYVQTEDMFNRIFGVLKFIVVIILILGIYNTMTMSVKERIPEMGTLMAMGNKRKDVIRLFLVEGFLLGLLGGIAGLLVGSILTWGIARIGIPMPPPPGASMEWFSEPTVVWISLLWAFVLALIASIVSAWLAASQGTRMEIADALRHSN